MGLRLVGKIISTQIRRNWIPDDAELHDIQISKEGLKVSDRGDYVPDYTLAPVLPKEKE